MPGLGGMSVQRPSLTEPFPLARVRETFADWFESQPKYSQPFISVLSSLSFLPSERIVVRGAGELAPSVAGAVAGAVAGPAMLAVSIVLAMRERRPVALASQLGALVSRGLAAGGIRAALGWGVASIAGALIGVAFGTLTRRLRRFGPMVFFAATLSSAIWTVVHLVLMRRFAPGLADALPFEPMVLGAMTFGAVLALEVPLRTRIGAQSAGIPARP